MIDRQLGAEAEAALYDLVLDGALHVEPLTRRDWERTRELVEQYADLHLGGTDASLIAIAERLQASQLATVDRTHFSVVRPRRIPPLELILPER